MILFWDEIASSLRQKSELLAMDLVYLGTASLRSRWLAKDRIASLRSQ